MHVLNLKIFYVTIIEFLDKLYIYSCRYNYRPDHCMYMSVCQSAEKDGVVVLHGSRGFFHSEKQALFQMVYKAFEEVCA